MTAPSPGAEWAPRCQADPGSNPRSGTHELCDLGQVTSPLSFGLLPLEEGDTGVHVVGTQGCTAGKSALTEPQGTLPTAEDTGNEVWTHDLEEPPAA